MDTETKQREVVLWEHHLSEKEFPLGGGVTYRCIQRGSYVLHEIGAFRSLRFPEKVGQGLEASSEDHQSVGRWIDKDGNRAPPWVIEAESHVATMRSRARLLKALWSV